MEEEPLVYLQRNTSFISPIGYLGPGLTGRFSAAAGNRTPRRNKKTKVAQRQQGWFRWARGFARK